MRLSLVPKEHDYGDKIVHDIIRRRNKAFIRPIEREDIYDLVASLYLAGTLIFQADAPQNVPTGFRPWRMRYAVLRRCTSAQRRPGCSTGDPATIINS